MSLTNRALLALALCARPAAAELSGRWVELRRDLHRHPELANREARTMEAIAKALRAAGVESVRTGAARTGVIAEVRGALPGPVVAVRAPIDAMALAEAPAHAVRSEVPGVSHACGHDAMAAMAGGAAEILLSRRAGLAGTVRFLFQPAEEGAPPGEEGGAALLVKEGAMKGVAAAVAMHVEPDIPLGSAGYREGPVHAGLDDFEIKVIGAQAHGATPWKGVDAAAVAAQLVSALQLIVSRQTDFSEPVVLTVGTIRAGTAPNALAAEAVLTGTLRSYTEKSRRAARESLERVARHVPEAFGAKGEARFTDEIPPDENDPGLARKLSAVLERRLGAGKVEKLRPLPYSDDFSFMSRKAPAFYFDLGVRDEARGYVAGTHTPGFDVPDEAVALGASLLADLSQAALAR